jgi:hypothetical protein
MPVVASRGSLSVRAYGRGGGVSYAPTSTIALINNTNVSSNTTTISYLDINPNYTDLYLLANVRSDYAGDSDFLNIKFNSDSSSSNYNSTFYTNAIVNGQSVTANTYARFTSNAGLRVPGVNGATATANLFGVVESDFINISNASDYKTVITRHGQFDFGTFTCCQAAGDGNTGVSSGMWESTAAISSITITPQLGTNFVSGSSFSLYGITRNGGFGS